MIRATSILFALTLACTAQVATPSAANVGEAEAQKVEDRIATVRRDILGKYEMSLGELQHQFQKAADLEGAVAVRTERTRLAAEQALSEKNYVNEPKSLRNLQQSMVGKMHDLVASVVSDSLPKLLDYKKQLTVDGRLDDALAVKQSIERLQNANVPISRAEAGSIVTADALVQSYSADRSRADKTYKGVRLVARGVMSGYRLDPNDAKTLMVYLSPQSGSGWVQCAFNLSMWRYREDKIAAGTFLVLIAKDGSEVRLGRGLQVDILGDCTGWDEMVKLTKCDVSR